MAIRTPLKHKIVLIAKVTTESVHKHTGKYWDEWIQILDRVGGRSMEYSEITKYLGKYRIGRWWQGAVAMGYEIHTGARVEGRNKKGQYSVTATKTIYMNRKALWKALTTHQCQTIWLKPLTPIEDFAPKVQFEVEGGVFGEIRTIKAPERMRLRWQDTDWVRPSVVNIGIASNRDGRSILYFMHEGLPAAVHRDQMRKYWRQRLEELHRYFKSSTQASSLDSDLES